MAWLQPLVKMTSCKEHTGVSRKHSHSQVPQPRGSDIMPRLCQVRASQPKRQIQSLTESRKPPTTGELSHLLRRVEEKSSGQWVGAAGGGCGTRPWASLQPHSWAGEERAGQGPVPCGVGMASLSWAPVPGPSVVPPGSCSTQPRLPGRTGSLGKEKPNMEGKFFFTDRCLFLASTRLRAATQLGEAHLLVTLSQGGRDCPASGQAPCSPEAGPGRPRAGSDPGQGGRLWPQHVLDTELMAAG